MEVEQNTEPGTWGGLARNPQGCIKLGFGVPQRAILPVPGELRFASRRECLSV
jgi:hypothetical protein